MRRWEGRLEDARREGLIDGLAWSLGVVGVLALAGLKIAGVL